MKQAQQCQQVRTTRRRCNSISRSERSKCNAGELERIELKVLAHTGAIQEIQEERMFEEIKDTNSENSTAKERQIKKQLGSLKREQIKLNKESSYAQIHSFHLIHFSCMYARI